MRSGKVFYVFLLFINLALPLAMPAKALVSNPNSNIRPGYISYTIPLADFVSPSLKAACAALVQGNDRDATAQFESYLKNHPNDPSAIVGDMEASLNSGIKPLDKYIEADKITPSAANDLRAGLTALSLLEDKLSTTTPQAMAEKKTLAKIIRTKLEDAYRKSHAPIVGIVLQDTYFITGGGDAYGILEDMLRREAGQTAYDQYVRAKNSGWNASIPPVTNVAKDRLIPLAWIVRCLWSLHGMRHGRHVVTWKNGQQHSKDVMSDVDQTDADASDYLERWREAIKRKATSM